MWVHYPLHNFKLVIFERTIYAVETCGVSLYLNPDFVCIQLATSSIEWLRTVGFPHIRLLKSWYSAASESLYPCQMC